MRRQRRPVRHHRQPAAGLCVRSAGAPRRHDAADRGAGDVRRGDHPDGSLQGRGDLPQGGRSHQQFQGILHPPRAGGLRKSLPRQQGGRHHHAGRQIPRLHPEGRHGRGARRAPLLRARDREGAKPRAGAGQRPLRDHGADGCRGADGALHHGARNAGRRADSDGEGFHQHPARRKEA